MKYQGSCHCQKIRFEVEMNIESALSCNCSICRRRGSFLVFAPESSFKQLSGESELKDYQFGKKQLHHFFCSTCGSTPFASGKTPDGTIMHAVNVRCLDNFDLENLKIQKYDGASK